jgi:hypothetical protein
VLTILVFPSEQATEIKKSAKKEKGYWNYEIINKKVKAKTPLPKAPL